MFGPRLGTVFASRWKALWWASAVLLTAWCSVPAPEDNARDKSAADNAATARDIEALRRQLP